MTNTRRRARLLKPFLAGLAAALLVLSACGGSDASGPAGEEGPRPFRMGFSGVPPRLTTEEVLRTVDLWSERADAAVMHVDVPWALLLDGGDAEQHVRDEILPLGNLYRARGMAIAFTAEPGHGLARDREAEPLEQRGRSIAEPEVQALYVEWVTAVARLLDPDWMGLAAETNLIRQLAPAATYRGLVQMAATAADAIAALPSPPSLYVSVQVDAAWGRLTGTGGWVGITDDLADFPYIDVLGLSSYPYLAGFQRPAEIPLDYYSRLRDEAGLDVLVVEGGWPSESTDAFTTSEAEQADYLRRQAVLLDSARALAVLQLTFTDLDLPAWDPPPGSILPLFASLGLVGEDYAPKPALAVWDSLFDLPAR